MKTLKEQLRERVLNPAATVTDLRRLALLILALWREK